MAKQKPQGKSKNPSNEQTEKTKKEVAKDKSQDTVKIEKIKADDTSKTKSQDNVSEKQDNQKYVEKVSQGDDDFKKEQDDKIKIQGKLEKIVPVDTDSNSEILRKVLTIMSGVIILVCLVVLIASTVKKGDTKGSRDANINPVANFSGVSQVDEIEYPQKIQEKFKKLYVANKEIIGIISIDNLNIESPVVQAKDNKYYANHNFYKAKSPDGTAFLDVNSKPDLSSQNTIVYANNKEKDTFSLSKILEFKDTKVYKETPVFSFDTLYDNYRWKIYAVYTVATDEKDDKNFFDYTNQDLIATDFENYIKQIDMRKFYTTGVDVLQTDKLITISVPDINDKKTSTRFVVVARLLRDGESEEVDFSNIKNNANPYKPQAY